MIVRALLCGLAFGLASTASAAASERTGSKSEPELVRSVQAVGQCLANTRTAEVASLLALDFRERAYRDSMLELARTRTCQHHVVSGGWRTGGLMYGGALAEGMLKARDLLPALRAATAYDPARPVLEVRNGGEMVAVCLVRTVPEQVAALLATEAASSDELAKLQSLGATLPSCVPANSKSEFTRESLRALLALAAYRLASHNGAAG